MTRIPRSSPGCRTPDGRNVEAFVRDDGRLVVRRGFAPGEVERQRVDESRRYGLPEEDDVDQVLLDPADRDARRVARNTVGPDPHRR